MGGNQVNGIHEHRVTIIVELRDGAIIQKVKEFSGGNPLFHATEVHQAVKEAAWSIEQGIAGMYGDIRGRETK